ncbi:hypothetical protein FVEG_00426 [Fusarium verticillioides 7600]|uniref:Uncharacterized protein n=1 Tax=Gibberella moniliformis (strain M3125 / FGSC 7600) TaxID=334819 RepID=W7LLF5_GIBM7|nr:hypothetical protein FVEG_00426 [Fusarium verticillioides 7600]XP_018742551.1 hypothetical protein FVEG_00426 [Fusarium verticillioides 7600]EWG36359.1 hypothetical protein FVEG_00426 [Fusarium verticillioides 7600]EWG36360.1 hypothetical protein FVEG_00426 [Fusarium verticillioides 7600]
MSKLRDQTVWLRRILKPLAKLARVRELGRDGDGGSSWKSWGVVCKIYVSDAKVVILICVGPRVMENVRDRD